VWFYWYSSSLRELTYFVNSILTVFVKVNYFSEPMQLPLGLMDSSFLFPQMLRRKEQNQHWTPHFVDYLFLAFNTSTAFSPTIRRFCRAGQNSA